MRRSIRRKGRLIQKVIKNNFRILSIDNTSQKISVVGEYPSFEKAKEVVDKMDVSEVSFYVYNNSNRVLYEREKS